MNQKPRGRASSSEQVIQIPGKSANRRPAIKGKADRRLALAACQPSRIPCQTEGCS